MCYEYIYDWFMSIKFTCKLFSLSLQITKMSDTVWFQIHACLGRAQKSNLLSTQLFLKLSFQSAWQHLEIYTLSSLSWHWFYSQEEDKHGGMGGEVEQLMDRGGSRGKRKCGRVVSAHHTVEMLCLASLTHNPVIYEQAKKHTWQALMMRIS